MEQYYRSNDTGYIRPIKQCFKGARRRLEMSFGQSLVGLGLRKQQFCGITTNGRSPICQWLVKVPNSSSEQSAIV